MTNDIYRILTPGEFEALLDAIPRERSRIVVEALLYTGMRYSELVEFSGHLSWFDAKNRVIALPASSTKTKEDRPVHLTPAFTKRLSMYLREHKKLEVPHIMTMNGNLKRWYWDVPEFQGMNWYPTPKTFRKTWESWLLFAGYESLKVALSQGHTQTIQLQHYANMAARLKSEADAVKRLTEGWMT